MLNVSFALQLANNFLGPLKWMKNYSRKGETYFFLEKGNLNTLTPFIMVPDLDNQRDERC